jgi:hypothetical protein
VAADSSIPPPSSRPREEIEWRHFTKHRRHRGEAGDFKVNTKFRFYGGGEDQSIDPLIASIEGVGATPAYRGLALAVFEDLELAEFGNRIPFMTFELVADEAAPQVGEILEDASHGWIQSDEQRTASGYAAHGQSQRAALEPLINCFGVRLTQAGGHLSSSGAGPVARIDAQDLGCSVEVQPQPSLKRTRDAEAGIPTSVSITYYDPSRSYQTGQARASVGGLGHTEMRLDAPVVLNADQAKGLAQDFLATQWSAREKLAVQLAPKWMGLIPGDLVAVPGASGTWEVERCVVEGMSLIADLRPSATTASNVGADAGRAFRNPDIPTGATTLMLFDLPTDEEGYVPRLHIGAASPTSGWKPVAIRAVANAEQLTVSSAPRQSVIGRSVGALAGGQALVFDLNNSVEIQLVDTDDWLTSCDDRALANWLNLAVLGDELLQFGSVEATGPGRFRLSRLLRGRRGTEWAMAEHQAAEPFAMLLAGTLATINLPHTAAGSLIAATPLGLGDTGAPAVTKIFNAEGLRPLSPVHLNVAKTSGGGLHLNWVRRSRYAWVWRDEIEAPLGEAQELYRVSISSDAGSVKIDCSTASLSLLPEALKALGSGPATVAVQQIGDRAVSRPVAAQITLT